MPATWGYSDAGTQGATMSAWGYATNLEGIRPVLSRIISTQIGAKYGGTGVGSKHGSVAVGKRYSAKDSGR